MVKVVEIVAVSECVLDGNEGSRGARTRQREREAGQRQADVHKRISQPNICLSVSLGRHVSAPPD